MGRNWGKMSERSKCKVREMNQMWNPEGREDMGKRSVAKVFIAFTSFQNTDLFTNIFSLVCITLILFLYETKNRFSPLVCIYKC